MGKIIILFLALLGNAYGMDGQKTLLDKIPKDLRLMIGNYCQNLTCMAYLQDKLDHARSLKELEDMINGNEDIKSAALKLDLSKFSDEITNDNLQKIVTLMPYLAGLNLSKCVKIDDDGFSLLKGLAHLRYLDLSLTAIGDVSLSNLVGLSQLVELILWRTRISDAGLTHVKGLTQLTTLVLENIWITDSGLENLEDLTNLTKLNVYMTSVTIQGINNFKKKVPNVEIIKTL